jgi:hypothetical protein
MWLGLHGYRASVMGAKVVSALLCWPFGDGSGGWVLMVRGHSAIRAYRDAGWMPLGHDIDVRFADVSDVRQSEIRRFQDWRQAWEDDGA